MISLPTGLEYKGVYVFADDSGAFQYVPGSPSPQRTSGGVPAWSLIEMGDMAMLQGGVQWDLDPANLVDELRMRIAGEHPDLAPDTIRIVPAPVTVDAVRITVDNGNGGEDVLATSRGSGFRPFTAIFGVSLTHDQKKPAKAAMSGTEKSMRVYYDVHVAVSSTVVARISGDLTEAISNLPDSATQSDARQVVDEAIEAGNLKLVCSGPPSDSLQEAINEAKDKAAMMLLNTTGGSAMLEAEATRRTANLVPLTRIADVALWFRQGR